MLKDMDRDFGNTTQNIILSISKSHDLYKNLIKQTHPDRFQDNKREMATELSMRITKAKRNYSELVKLQEEVENFKSS
ncbi:J domain-containing protein [Emticicia fluvialis]|uniref:J domain-containing protein n=1 Tax=Emticicia fluvialis TaxID=2974474 RepID=UPI0021669225|nr:J domain-containing protein [Emticicia fluvialis]